MYMFKNSYYPLNLLYLDLDNPWSLENVNVVLTLSLELLPLSPVINIIMYIF